MISFEHTPRSVRSAITASTVAALAVTLAWVLLWTELHVGIGKVDWTVFTVISVLLIACERAPSTWISFGPSGTVTPLWMFAFGLMLLGSPSAAVGVALVGATLHSIREVRSVVSIVMRVASVAISLSAAALVLLAFRVRGAITRADTMPLKWAAAIVVAGGTVLCLNALLAALAISIKRRISFVGLIQRGFGLRVTAEGALLSLAPIWVIGIDFSLGLAPLLGITTVLVHRSTRHALEQSHEAHHDPLTGLYNRRAFHEHVAEALVDPGRSDRAIMVVMDLDGFKEINDQLGHQLGDALLIAFADQLHSSLPPGSIACRLGGDEFAVLLVERSRTDDTDRTIEALHAGLTRPLDLDGFPISVSVSVGVAEAPTDGRTPDELLRAADVAMYRAKGRGGVVERYENCLQVPHHGRLNLMGDLSSALQRHELHIEFQPQLRMSDGVVETVEALIRWRHPEYGPIPPADFIGLAEQTDLIGPLTERVLAMATQLLVGERMADVNLAVNVSARSLHDPRFANRLFEVLAASDFPPDRLEVEITERAIVSEAERTTHTIAKLREAGIRIAIDDFGVGYSSYQTLRLLDVDRVKVDRDFVQGLLIRDRDRVIVSSLIRLAHELRLDVVAEGVESVAIWNELATLGCDVAQGFGIAPPMLYPHLRNWMADWETVTSNRLDLQRVF